MLLSDMVKEVEEWLNSSCGEAVISSIEGKMNGNYIFYIDEVEPCANSYFLTVTEEGQIFNDNGDDVIEASLASYKNLPEAIKFLTDFRKRWYFKTQYEEGYGYLGTAEVIYGVEGEDSELPFIKWQDSMISMNNVIRTHNNPWLMSEDYPDFIHGMVSDTMNPLFIEIIDDESVRIYEKEN